MPAKGPHYLLFSEAEAAPAGSHPPDGNRWRFVLEALGDGRRRVVEDVEPDSTSSRLELLAVVRGLEALDGPSRVTLVTRSRYVSQGFHRGLSEWRRHDWCWERFGRRVPIRDHDLWRRVDRALHFHQVDCRVWRFSASLADAAENARCAESASIHCGDQSHAVSVPPCHTTQDWSVPAVRPDAAEVGPAVVIVPKPKRRRRTHLAGFRDRLAELRRTAVTVLSTAGQFFVPRLARV